jgi:hypothetical protein
VAAWRRSREPHSPEWRLENRPPWRGDWRTRFLPHVLTSTSELKSNGFTFVAYRRSAFLIPARAPAVSAVLLPQVAERTASPERLLVVFQTDEGDKYPRLLWPAAQISQPGSAVREAGASAPPVVAVAVVVAPAVAGGIAVAAAPVVVAVIVAAVERVAVVAVAVAAVDVVAAATVAVAVAVIVAAVERVAVVAVVVVAVDVVVAATVAVAVAAIVAAVAPAVAVAVAVVADAAEIAAEEAVAAAVVFAVAFAALERRPAGMTSTVAGCH